MKYRNTIFFLLFLFLFSSCGYFFLDNDSFTVYETPHYVFFYLEGSKIADDIEDIVVESEKSLIWASKIMNMNIDLKIDGYLFDDATKTSYYKTINTQNINATFANEYCFQYCYDRDFYKVKSAVPVILHETLHIVQASLFLMNNVGMYEGHSTYMQIKYELYSNNSNYSDIDVFYNVNQKVKESLFSDKEYPHTIFCMSNSEFQNIDSVTLLRDPKSRYEVCTSFIAYLVYKYGIDKLKDWFYKTDKYNFVANFNKIYETNFYLIEKEWVIEVLSN